MNIGERITTESDSRLNNMFDKITILRGPNNIGPNIFRKIFFNIKDIVDFSVTQTTHNTIRHNIKIVNSMK